MQYRSSPIEGRTRLGRPYLKIGAVIAIGAGILAAGILGPRAPGSSKAPPASSVPSPVALVASPAVPATTLPHYEVDALSELARVYPLPGSVHRSRLPVGAGIEFLAADGMTVYYVDQANKIESTVIGSDAPPRTLVTVARCQAIGPLEAAGHELVYAITWPFDPTRGAACGDAGVLGWSVWLLNMDTGKSQKVAEGTRPAGTGDLAASRIHLAITTSSYAFDRLSSETDPSQGMDVEVHSIGGRLLWQTHSQAPVVGIMLGGNRLAVVTDIPGTPLDGGADRIAWLSSAADPPLNVVALAATAAALSNDGVYLTWDYPFHEIAAGARSLPNLGVTSVSAVGPATTISESSAIQALEPAVASTDRGPLIAWLAASADGDTYPAFDYLADGVPSVLDSPQQAVWIAVEGGELIWVTATEGGSAAEAFAVDLSTLGQP